MALRDDLTREVDILSWFLSGINRARARIAGGRLLDDGEALELPHLNHVLAATLPPDFRLESSHISRDLRFIPGEDAVFETWIKAPAGSSPWLRVKLALYLAPSPTAASRAVYGATTEPDQYRAIGKPTPGSYSGQIIGDFCWASTVSLTPGPRPDVNPSSRLVVVAGRNLFGLQVTSRHPVVEDAFTEDLAHRVVARLQEWPRPNATELSPTDSIQWRTGDGRRETGVEPSSRVAPEP